MKAFYVVIPTLKIDEHLDTVGTEKEKPNTAFNLKSSYFRSEQDAIKSATDKTRLYHSPHVVMKAHILIEPILVDVDIKKTNL